MSRLRMWAAAAVVQISFYSIPLDFVENSLDLGVVHLGIELDLPVLSDLYALDIAQLCHKVRLQNLLEIYFPHLLQGNKGLIYMVGLRLSISI